MGQFEQYSVTRCTGPRRFRLVSARKAGLVLGLGSRPGIWFGARVPFWVELVEALYSAEKICGI